MNMDIAHKMPGGAQGMLVHGHLMWVSHNVSQQHIW